MNSRVIKRSKSRQLASGLTSPREPADRCLSPHVCSRWYRPPEVILVESNYNQKIDIWSTGCIMAEMLFCMALKQTTSKSPQDLNHKELLESRFAFSGTHCYPLSPRASRLHADPTAPAQSQQTDQLYKILLGLPQLGSEDISFIQNQNA